jgi:hypothetical protein
LFVIIIIKIIIIIIIIIVVVVVAIAVLVTQNFGFVYWVTAGDDEELLCLMCPTDQAGSYRFVFQRTETVSVRNIVMFRILGLKCFKARWLLYVAYHPLEHEGIPRFVHKMYLFHIMSGINSDYFPEVHELN